jgi:hypothetical protein
MEKTSTGKMSKRRKILYIIGGVLVSLGLAAFIFFNFFFQDVVNNLINSKVKEATRTSTHGLFRLEIGKVKYKNGSLYCTKVEIIRAKYDSTESGLTIKKLSADSVYFDGLNILDILLGRGLFMARMETHSPKIFLTNVAAGREEIKNIPVDTTPIPKVMPGGMPVISYDSIILSDIHVFIPQEFKPSGMDSSYSGLSVKLSGMRLDNDVLKSQPLFYCKGIDLSLRTFPYNLADSCYILSIEGLHVSLTDSLVTLDTFSFHSKYSEDVFASKHKYATAMLDFRCNGMRVEGIDFNKSIADAAIEFRKFSIRSFYIDSYEDMRLRPDPHPSAVMFPNELFNSIPANIKVDSVVFQNGKMKMRERWSAGIGTLGFENVCIAISPVSKDSTNLKSNKPAKISLSALFLGEALLKATFIYPLDQKNFDMDIHATLGSFNAKKLNQWLIPIERLEVVDGTLESGKIDMSVRSGKTTTTILPVYHNFSMKVLTKNPHEQRGFAEAIKTFFASTFVVRGNNPKALGGLKTGITSRNRIRTEDFFQFLWAGVRKSLGQVVGGFQ